MFLRELVSALDTDVLREEEGVWWLAGPLHAVLPVSTVTLQVGSIVVGVAEVQRALDFWSRALGYQPREEPDDTWVVLVPQSGHGPNISLALSETPVQDRPRVHLDLYAADQAAEVDCLIELGASRVDWQDYPQDADFVVLADTEGNRFCVIDKGSTGG